MKYSFHIVVIAALMISHGLKSTNNTQKPFYSEIDNNIFYVSIGGKNNENCPQYPRIKPLSMDKHEQKINPSLWSRFIFGDIVMQDCIQKNIEYNSKSIESILNKNTINLLIFHNILSLKQENNPYNITAFTYFGLFKTTLPKEQNKTYTSSTNVAIFKRDYTKPLCLAGFLTASLVYFFLKDKNIVITN